ncbi:MAG: phage terminase large subunit family protein [Patescibacteria group bacterium]|nr:phage terminase large subunit family protein [Patescibacteria group bacterium]
MSPVQAIMKCSQIGASTMLNIKALWLAAAREMDIIYSLPSASDAHDFVSSKTNRLIANTPIFRRWIKDKDSVEQKRVLKNVIYFRGTRTKQAALSIPADLYIADEVDRSDEETVRQYLSRLHHSRYGWRWYLSNPSVIGHGVSEWWERSDQKHWFVKCDCGKGEYHGWQFMTMDNLMGSPLYFGCRFCGKELNRKEGRWIKKYRDRREVSGYWLSLLMAPWVTAAQIMERKNDMTAEQFSNFVLGEPYTGVKNTLTRQSFFQNLTPAVNSQEGRIIIGVDTGEAINLVAGNKEGLFYYSKTDDYAELTSLLNRWPNSIAIIDQGGDIIGPRKLREKFRNRVYLCFFARDRKNDELVRWNDDEGTVIADRNKTIQLVVDEFSERRIPVNGTEAEWLDFYLEWARMYRTVEKSETGPPVYEWHKPTSGRADYPFCAVYWRIGMDKFKEDRARFITPSPAGGKVGSPAIDSFTGRMV